MMWYQIVAGICLAMVSTSSCQTQNPDCGDVMCAMYCEYGFKLNEDGCKICECNAQTEIKIGACPAVDPDIVSTCVEQCEHDGTCPGEEKCCSDGCGHQCRAPVRLGYCPDVIQCGGGNPACTADSDCKNSTFKCCSNGCGNSVCIPPAEEKRGTCPIGSLPEGSLGLCAEQCSMDSDCPALQKCCSNGCGHVCIKPADLPVIHSGTCPVVEQGGVGICASVCQNDGVCADDEKCCPNSCNGYTCVKAVDIKPACDVTCLMWCPYGLQIDDNGCDICACQEPTQIHAGECPAVPSDTVGSCVNLCSHDGECTETQKCCSNGCGRTCVDSVEADPVGCPVVSPDVVGTCDESCGESCPGSQLCCSNGCGHQCTDPVTVHEGECPTGELASNVIGACVEMCQYDGECASDQKCCSNGCGHACTTQNKTQANCPDVTCLMFCDYGNKKDSNGCDICECQDSIEAGVERPGECPVGFLPEGIVGTCVEECSSDNNCTNTAQKCCSNGCGHVCVDALNVGPQCPPVCQRYCEFGNVKDENGCDTCLCNSESVCAAVMCMMHCPYGYKEDDNGCDICQCEDKPEGCSDVLCAMICLHGFQRDSEGCEVCQCTTEELATFSAQGSCPAPPADYSGSCADLCDIDSECNEGEKCCYNGCGRTCMQSSGAASILSTPTMLVVLSTLLSALAIRKL